jgi:hypothetical protein
MQVTDVHRPQRPIRPPRPSTLGGQSRPRICRRCRAFLRPDARPSAHHGPSHIQRGARPCLQGPRHRRDSCLRQAGGRAGALSEPRCLHRWAAPQTTLPTRLPSAIGTSTGCPMTPRFVDRAEGRELADPGECPHLVLSDGRKPA